MKTYAQPYSEIYGGASQRAIKAVLSVALVCFILFTNSATAQISGWTNGVFENGLTGWTVAANSGTATFAVTGTSVHSGTRRLEVAVAATGSTDFPSLAYASFSGSSSSTYVVSFWAYSTVNRPLMRLHIASTSGSSYSVDFQPSSAGWDEYHYPFKASGTTSLSFTFEGVATYYLDDIIVYDQNDAVIDTPTTYLWHWGQYTYAQSHSNSFKGGDNDISAQLPDGRIAWIFNDTLTGSLNFNSNYRGSCSMPRNFIVIQSGTVLAPLTGTTSFIPATSGNIYWPNDATVENDKLQVFLCEVSDGGSGSQVDQVIATLSLPGLTLDGITERPWKGSRIVKGGDGYFYIYLSPQVARAAIGSLTGTGSWTFYNGSAWVSDSTQAIPLANLNGISSMERLGPNNFVAISYGVCGVPIYAQFAPSPVGPWSNGVTVGTPPGQAGISYYYMPFIHKQSAQNGVYSIGYSDNGGAENDSNYFSHVYANKCFYSPHYIKTPNLLDLSPYTTNTLSEDFTNSYDDVEWQPYGGTWSITGGKYVVTASLTGYYSIAKGIVASDFAYEADVACTSSTSSGQSGIIFRGSNFQVGSDNYYGYNVTLKPNSGVSLGTSNGGGTHSNIATKSMAVVSGSSYHVKVVAIGTSLQVYVTNMTTPIISATNSTYSSGGIGVRVYQATGSWDNISVTPYELSAEAETLTVAASSGKTNTVISDSEASSGKAVTYASQAVGDYVVYPINVSKAGTYRINVGFGQGANCGIVGLSIGTSATGSFTDYGSQNIDLYSSTSGYADVGPIATVTFPSAGVQYFKFKITGKNSAASSYQLLIDKISLLKK
ncbi:MAG: DUF5005 domain-containing protein [Chthoniobacteraceae bacterium]